MRVGCQGITKQFWHHFFYTKTIRNLKVAPPPVHPGADQSLRVVRELGIDTDDSIPKLHIAPDIRLTASNLLEKTGLSPESKFVSINPFSRWHYKEWDNAKWGR